MGASTTGYSVLHVPFVAGLPFSRPVGGFIGALRWLDGGLPFCAQLLAVRNEEEAPGQLVLVAGGANLTSADQVESAIREPCGRFTCRFETSKLESQRHAGCPSLIALAYLPVLGEPPAASVEKKLRQLKKPGSLGAVPLPVSALECRIAERLHVYHDANELQRHVDEYIDELEKLEKKQQKTEPVADEDGFIKVVGCPRAAGGAGGTIPSRSTLSSPFIRGHQVSMQTSSHVATLKKRKGGVETDFYRFQIRQKQQQDLETFRQRRKEDIATIAEMRRNKKFRVR